MANVFPEEIWLKILTLLDNPGDLGRVAESCDYLEKLLERGSADIPGACVSAFKLVEVLPLILKWLGRRDVLNLRGVCCRVRLTVDQTLDENTFMSPYETLHLFPLLVRPSAKGYEYWNLKLPSSLLPAIEIRSPERLRDLTGTPKTVGNRVIVGGKETVHYVFYNEGDSGEEEINEGVDDVLIRNIHEENLLTLFQGFSEQISLQSISVRLSLCRSQLQVYIFMGNVLRLLPNLRRIEIMSFHVLSPSDDQSDAQLAAHVSAHPLPRAKHLEYVSLELVFCPEEILKEISERYGCQLKGLSMIVEEYQYAGATARIYEFPALLQMKLLVRKRFQGYSFRINAPILKKLHWSDTAPYGPTIDQLIRLIGNYHGVEDLSLDLSNVLVSTASDALDKLDRTGAAFREITRVSVINPERSNIPIHFFTRMCPNLQSICFEEEGIETRDPDLLMLRARHMKESKIWNEAASLQRVKHCLIKFTSTSSIHHIYECTRPLFD